MKKKYLQSVSLLSLLCAAGPLISGTALANPQDGVVSGGAATITDSGKKLDILQSTDRAIIDWRSFNIAPDEHTQFYQPSASSITLNRINSADPSQIMGQLSANGNLMIINPSGVIFGKDSHVDVNGLVATSSNISNADFMAGQLNFTQPGNPDAAIINEGTITAKDAGLVGLVAPNVSNSGTITAKLGKVHLASGDTFSVDLYGDGLMDIALSDDVKAQLVSNTGVINADGGEIRMTAAKGGEVLNSLITIEGELKAPSVSQKNGKIIIAGDVISHTGTIDVSGATGGSAQLTGRNIAQQGKILAKGRSGKGGSVDISFTNAYLDNEQATTDATGNSGDGGDITVQGAAGSHAFISGKYDSSSVTGKGGAVTLTAEAGDLKLFGAHVLADGLSAGGSVLIGGDYQGTGSTAHSSTTSVNYATTLSANATRIGNGGKVIVWSDEQTLFGGHALAKGGATEGNGGLIEISSKETMKIAGNAETDASASNGLAGTLLLDPKNITIATGGLSDGISSFQFIDPNADAGAFGLRSVALSTGNVAIADSLDSFAAAGAGAVYLFNGVTGGLISTITGAQASDAIGSGLTALTNGNFLITSTSWRSGANANAGAVTFANGVTGISGTVTSTNSLVGSKTTDRVGNNGITELANGNYVVRSSLWDNGSALNAGAVTWGSGTTGVKGVVSSSNSLVGSKTSDSVGSTSIEALSNGNYIISSRSWDNGSAIDAGAITWADGSVGVSGTITSANSLVGSTTNDRIGYDGITILTNGNYLVKSSTWLGGTGAVTWGSATTGVKGTISSSNSLIGSLGGTYAVGSGAVTLLSNGNYVISSPAWTNSGTSALGAVTWGSGATGVSGVISSSNSLVGSRADDRVGNAGVTALTNGNYVITSYQWDNGTVLDAGAVTWGSGTAGVAGTINSSNSLIGSTAYDAVGIQSVTALSNGNYVVNSSTWNNGDTLAVGAVTWGNGATGTSGVVSNTNSLIGSTAYDAIGNYGITVLTNGNYVVNSPNWDNGAVNNAGAVTWGSGTTGITGTVGSGNSLVGTTVNESLGSSGTTALTNGNYVVRDYSWDNGAVSDVGAIVWGNGATGITGNVTTSNALVGSTAGDSIGNSGITALANGNYVILSSFWDNGTASDAGAITWASGTTSTIGTISASNSLFGTASGDYVGNGGVTELSNGNFLVRSSNWNNGAATLAGAVTWASGTASTTGAISTSNSLVGSTAGDSIGSIGITLLTNGNYAVVSNSFDNGAVSNAGAVTWGNAATGTFGVVSASNSLIGSTADDQVGGYTDTYYDSDCGCNRTDIYNNVIALSNGNYIVYTPTWDNGANTDAGAVTWGSGTTGISGVVSSSNSLVGESTNDQIGNGGITLLGNGNYVVTSTGWDNGALVNAGALTLGDATTGTRGTITTANSILGNVANGTLQAPKIDAANNRIIASFTSGGRVLSLMNTYEVFGNYDSFTDNLSSSTILDPSFITNILNAGNNVILQASNDITLNNNIIANNPSDNGGALTLQAGRSILLNANITTDNGNLNLYANEKLATGVVNAERDPGTAAITMAAGTSINAGTGAVNIRLDDGAGKTNSAGGNITLRNITAGSITAQNKNAGGDIVLASGALTASATGDAITLSSLHDFINNAGSAALSAATGRWLVYSTNPANDTIGALSNNFRRFSCLSSGACPTLGTGNGLLYSYTPILTATPNTITGISYGDAAPNLTGYSYTLSDYLGSDASADNVSGSLMGTTTYTAGANAGSYNVNYGTGSLSSAMGYSFTYADNATALAVAKKNITAAFTGGLTKTYGNANPSINYTNFTFSTLFGSDSASLFGSITANFGTTDANTNAGSGYAVTASIGATTNYNVTNTPATTLTINQRALSVTTDAKNKIHGDADPVFTGSNNLTAYDAALIAWTYSPQAYAGNAGNYTIAATATDALNRLSNYTRTNNYNNFVVVPDNILNTIEQTPSADPTLASLGFSAFTSQNPDLQPPIELDNTNISLADGSQSITNTVKSQPSYSFSNGWIEIDPELAKILGSNF